jgi:EpsI family protein
MPSLLKSGPALFLTVVLLAQAAVLRSAMHPEQIPSSPPLSQLTHSLGPWQFQRDGVMEKEVLDVLQADDVLTRSYTTADGKFADLYIAAFRSQRNGKAPHSPKNCLPGSGWSPLVEDETSIDVGERAPIVVNRYIVAHGDERDMVLYWYESRGRVVASEYKAKFWVVADAMRYNRTDTAIVRVIVPFDKDTRDGDAAQRTAVDFVKTFYPAIRQILPQ